MSIHTCLIAVVGFLSVLAQAQETGASVDPMIGTKGTGHAFPGPCRPFGLVQPSPDTGNGSWDYCSGYAYDDRAVTRFSQTHLNGTGQASLGDVGVLPFVGEAGDPRRLVGAFRKEDEHAELGYYRVSFANGVTTEIAAGERVAHYRFALPADGAVLLDFPYGLYREAQYLPKLTTGCDVTKVSARRLEGLNHSEIWAPRDIAYVVLFDRVPDSLEELSREKGDRGPRYVARFAKGGKVELRIALSAKSLAGARRNLDAEGGTAFEARVAETKAAWEKILTRLACPSSKPEDRQAFYTALYHLCIQPNNIADAGETPRYSTFSLWDTFRSAHPLYEKIVPELVPGFVNSLLDHYDRYGFLPRWELWGRETNCMIANHAVPVVVSAYEMLKDRPDGGGVDWEKAYRAVRDTLTKEFEGRTKADWAVYDRYGYYPYDLIPRESVSRTLECCSDDFRAAEFARMLGKQDDAAFFGRRSWNFTNLFDRATLLFRPRDSKGAFRQDFNPVSAKWGGDYTEGSAWQYVWHVLHRPEWLVRAMGGAEAFEKRLDAFFAGGFCADQPHDYSRDITGLIGDYAHGNEPCHHVAALYRLTAHPEKERAIVGKILDEFYRPEPGGLCGNDDCGQMSAWYLRAVLDRAHRKFVEVSSVNPRYFVTGEGKTWIPVGCNICFDRLYDGAAHGDAEVRANFDRWLGKFAANGGNSIRLWAGHRSLEVMPEKAGVYDPERTKTLRGIIARCEALGIRVKITFESFRMCLSAESERTKVNPKGVNFNYNHVFNRSLYAPYAKDVAAFFTSEECRRIYLGKAQYLKDLGFGDSPAVYCWELWNEINCCGTIAQYSAWSAWALAELKKMFPRQLTVNNLGSFSDVGAYQMYDELATERDNDFMQIHRYLDAGACLDVCRGPMDLVAASSVRELLARRPDRPAVVAEIGAVQANHAGPFPYYPFDKEGTLLHDALFAAFFAGSAGCGQFWHWDHQYIDGNDLWWQFRRFVNAIEGLDPVAEGFKPFYTESRRLRMYGLRGNRTAVIWCRDKVSSWESELVHGNKPELLERENVPFRNCRLDCYLPWEDRHVTFDAPTLPPFRRSIVVRVPADAVEGVVRAH